MDEQSQSQPINIVPMGPEHIETLARLEQVCFSAPWTFDALAGELSDPLAVFRVATVNGQVAGYVGMQHILDEGYICNIAVFPEYRRRGGGTALLHALDAYAKENGMAPSRWRCASQTRRRSGSTAGLTLRRWAGGSTSTRTPPRTP